MKIELNNIKPKYMSEAEVAASEVYLQANVVFEKGNKYLIKANSGHGKTSVLNFIYGSSVNFDGGIKYDNATSNSEIFDLRKDKISYLFQDFKLFQDLTVFENIQLKNTLTEFKSTEQINELISALKLDHKKDSLVMNLSLGERQRVAIIRALCQPFDYLLMDEPFSHLDKTNIKAITDIIDTELAERNASLILTSLGDEYLFDYTKVLNL